MINLGNFNPANYSAANPLIIPVASHPKYIRIINNSPYLLKIDLGGQGTLDFPEMFLEDIPLSEAFSGQLTIVPKANFSASTIARALSNLITVNAMGIGEVIHPQAQPIGTLSSVTNAVQEFQTSFVSVISLDVSVAFNTAQATLLPSAAFPNINLVSPQQPGFLLLGYLRSSNARELIVPYRNGFREGIGTQQTVTIPNGGGTQVFQLANATAIGSIGFQNWSVSNPNFGVNFINVDRNDNNFQSVSAAQPSIVSTTNQLLSLVNQFGPYGFEGYAPTSGGLRVQINFANPTGASQTFLLILTGSRFAFDDALLQVAYSDWASPANTYTLGFIRLGSVDQLPLNFLVPTPLTNSAQTTFGKLTYTVYNVTEYYSTTYLANKYTMDTIIPANLIIPGM